LLLGHSSLLRIEEVLLVRLRSSRWAHTVIIKQKSTE
jgi:hypothetical protein